MCDKYREHVVPASLLKDEAIKLAEEGAPAEVIADFLRHHFFIIWISFKEVEMLNSGTDNGGCSLKTTMPKGWVFGCNPLERLQDAGELVRCRVPTPGHGENMAPPCPAVDWRSRHSPEPGLP